MRQTVVFHPKQGYGMCRPVTTGPAQIGLTHPEHGRLVSCGACGRLGVIPEEGHELEFMPPGTERTPDGAFLLRLP